MNDIVEDLELSPVAREARDGSPLVKRNLSLLGHVNVKLDVVVGQVGVSIDQLFSLAKGEVLALDAELDEPVKVRLDGKTIALGHLVAVGDHFGIKISEIL
ncbi:FliM/FliN family flagellar motor switch protein [Dyella sedimenti]|uniref:FliM/FliN family flagellar motor switch protein n=1 Tax=Dyella sedimenti TaxID=2919947 RepID=UPI001FAA84AB|nr:FliM/FliN family flagellar motor switch protein [Dyella sedimenti]